LYSGHFGLSISADGRYVAFSSNSTDLIPGSAGLQIYVRDRLNGTIELASVDSNGTLGNNPSEFPRLTPDGRYVGFKSQASNLIPGDTGNHVDAFVRDRLNGTTERVSISTAGVGANDYCSAPMLSADGRFAMFSSVATNLVPGDTNGVSDIFVRDRLSGTTERVSVSTAGVQGNQGSFGSDGDGGGISADGRFVVFYSYATNLVANDTNDSPDIFVRDRTLGTTERLSINTAGAEANFWNFDPSISADGRFVAFHSYATNLVAGDTNGAADVFVRDRLNGTTERVTVDSLGMEGNIGGRFPSISATGRFVVFISTATNLVPNDTNGYADVFVHDRYAGTTERVSVDSAGTQTNGDIETYSIPQISDEGRFIVFCSHASDLVPNDTNGFPDAFLRDRGITPPIPFCFGDGSGGACPCGNNGASARGCENSASTGGAELLATGNASLANDTLTITSSGELASVLSIFLQGSSSVAPVNFGDGLRCAGGGLKRLYVLNASSGAVTAPPSGGASFSARSAALGDVLTIGSTRQYQTYYRDPNLTFCPAPSGGTFNVSNGLSILWGE
jgi:Tol biopolymer transport system component